MLVKGLLMLVTLSLVISRSKQQRRRVISDEYGCSLEIVVDNHLRTEFEGRYQEDFPDKWNSYTDLEASIHLRGYIINQISEIIQFTNDILKSYVFNGRIYKLYLQRIKILNDNDCKYKNVDYCKQLDSLLGSIENHSKADHSDVCLSYLLTNFQDPEGNLGQAFVAKSRTRHKSSGGVCAKFQSQDIISSDDSKSIYREDGYNSSSLNTGVVSFNHILRGRLSNDLASIVFAHEIGHSFGSPHDYPDKCLFDKSGGNFLMHPSVVQGLTESFKDFSSCSISNISLALASLSNSSPNCFIRNPRSVCGNGIVEAWEECDCGETEEDCKESCCHPANAGPTRGCQLKRGMQCSPSEGPCCSTSCEYIQPSDEIHAKCQVESECGQGAFCAGAKSSCPPSQPRPKGTTCNEGLKVERDDTVLEHTHL